MRTVHLAEILASTGEEPDRVSFPAAARRSLADTQLRANLARATTTIRDKRARVVGELPDWEELRAAGAAVKDRGAPRPRRGSSSGSSRR